VITIDGKKVGAVANGKFADFPLSAGPHRLRVSMDWAGGEVMIEMPPQGMVEATASLKGGPIGGFWRTFLQPSNLYVFEVKVS